MTNLSLCSVDLAYMTGFFDGEGCVYIRKEKHGYYIVVTIQQINREPLEKIRRAYGGSLLYRQEKGRKRGIHILRIQTQQAISFLSDIQRYLLVKQREVELTLCFSERPRFNRWHTASSVDMEIMEFYRTCLQKMKRGQ